MKCVKLFVIDVDGTMTDGGIFYDDYGNEWKKFNTKDAAAFFALNKCGIKTMVLTGRECVATSRRMKELKVDYLYQNVKDKVSFLRGFMEQNGIESQDIGYIGDDLNDLLPMRLACFVGCPADSCMEVKRAATYVSSVCGGQGAVRDIVENYLVELGVWSTAISEVYGIGI